MGTQRSETSFGRWTLSMPASVRASVNCSHSSPKPISVSPGGTQGHGTWPTGCGCATASPIGRPGGGSPRPTPWRGSPRSPRRSPRGSSASTRWWSSPGSPPPDRGKADHLGPGGCPAERSGTRGDLASRSLQEAHEAEQARTLSWWYFAESSRFGLFAELPPAQGAVVAKALERLAEQLPVMPGEEDGWCVDARRADALVALCSARISDDADPDRATVVIHAQLDGLSSGRGGCELEGARRPHRREQPAAGVHLPPQARARVGLDGVAGDGRGSPLVPPRRDPLPRRSGAASRSGRIRACTVSRWRLIPVQYPRSGQALSFAITASATWLVPTAVGSSRVGF